MNCEVICVGTELLLGDILNTNAQYLSRELAAMGVSQLRQSVIGDNPERLEAEIRSALERCDIIITSGGLGPTKDDLTKEVCCKALGVELELHEDILEGIRHFFEHRGSVMTENNRKQALIPKGGTVLNNSNGTAPGCVAEKNGKHIIMLPGPPRELVPMFENEVKPYLANFSQGVIFSRSVRLFGIGEAAMATEVEDLLDSANPTVAPYAKDFESLLRVTAKADSVEKAAEMCDETVATIKERLGKYIYGIDVESLQQRAVELLLEAGKTVAAAESCTGGFFAKRLTEIEGSSNVFECGMVTYSNEMKMRMLGVKKETLDKFTAVSEQTAAEMASRIRSFSGADIGIGITGFAGPGTDGTREAGLIYIGFDAEDRQEVYELKTGRTENSREYNRYAASSKALNMIIKYLQ